MMLQEVNEIHTRRDIYNLFNPTNNIIIWCMDNGLLDKKPICKIWGNDMKLSTKKNVDGYRWLCFTKKRKKKELSIRNNSFISNSHISIDTILLLIYEWSRNSAISDVIIDRKLDKKSIIDWYAFLRDVV